MSYILEALRRSEQERRRGIAPNLRSAPAIVFAQKRPPAWSLIMLAVLLIACGIAIGVLRPWQTNEAHRTPTVELQPALVEQSAVTASVPPRSPPDGERIVETPATTRVSVVASPPAKPAPAMSDVAPKVLPLAPAHAKRNSDSNAAVPVPKQVESPAPPSAPAPAASTPPKATSTEAANVMPRSEPAPEEHLPVLAELPPELRQQVPPLTLSVHFYSAQRAKSLVSINGQSLREGDEVSPELKLERITPSGVVMNYKGNRFQVGAQNWSR